jgi:hypothetical protein
MIISNLTGGLGNQMFQYAFGRAISAKIKASLKLHFTNALFNTQRSYELDVFNISATIATAADLQKFSIIRNRFVNRLLFLLDDRFGIQFNKHIVTQRYPYSYDSDYLSVKDESYIQGYWADERYFKEVEDIIRKEFTLKEKLDKRNQEILKQIRLSTSVSIHVRRGDYVTNKTNAFKFIGFDYYANSIKKIKSMVSDPVFFIFSDDIAWCKENLKQTLDKAYFVDWNNGRESYKDIVLMSACKHNIIANSTFSWWGGWLNQNKNKICIKPS